MTLHPISPIARRCAAVLSVAPVALIAGVTSPVEAQAIEERTGRLELTDPVLSSDDTRNHDRVMIQAEAGDLVTATLTSDDFDTFLIVVTPGGSEFTDDDGAGNGNSRLEFVAPFPGEYEVLVTAFGSEAEGDWTVTWERTPTLGFESTSGRLSRMTVKAQPFDSLSLDMDAGEVRIDVTVANEGNASFVAVSPTGERFEGTPMGSRTSTLVASSNEAGRWTFWVAGYDDMQNARYDLSVALLDSRPSTQITGRLDTDDEKLPLGEYVDLHEVEVTAGAPIQITVSSNDFDTFLVVETAGGTPIVRRNDDALFTGRFTSQVVFEADEVIGREGVWKIWVTSYGPGVTGAYEIRITR